MQRTPSLDDLALFLAVADAGRLAGAARTTGASVPTLSRRMARLEATIGQRLFARGARGYSLTERGRALVEESAGLRETAARVNRLLKAEPVPRVRITAGLWTSQLLARRMPDCWSRNPVWMPELLASNRDVDIARREADIGIRNRRPEQDWLAGRRTRRIEYAPFAAAPGIRGYITLPEDASTTPSERWLRANHPDQIVTTASDARLAADLAMSGAGQVILPVFAAAFLPGLVRTGPPIADLSHDEWLVCHHDARHDPPIRAAIEEVTDLLTSMG